MPAYLDAGFLLTTLIPATGSLVANRILRDGHAPIMLNFLHQIQVENFLVKLQKKEEVKEQRLGNQGQRMWRNYFAEGVFQMAPTDWDSAFRVAITWNNQQVATPPPFLLLLHPALAFVAGATQFLSFDPRARDVARMAGIKVLPDKL